MKAPPSQCQALQTPMLACNRVFGIQELLDPIRARLPFGDLKACTLVCRYWSSVFEPYLWTTVDLNKHAQGKMAALRRHGSNVVTLNFVHADKESFKLIRQLCPFVRSLSLVFDSRSSWVNYSCLEKFFSGMPQLATMGIRFDAFQFSPAMFWSLSQLPNLTSLAIDVFYVQYSGSKHYHPDAYMTILDCCPNLQELAVCGLFLEPADAAQFHFKSSFSQRVRKTLRSRRENAPSSTRQAIASSRHSRSWSSGTPVSRLGPKVTEAAHQESSSENVAIVPTVKDTSLQAPTYTIRKLDLRSPRMDDDVFCRLASRCTFLEELTLDGIWVRIRVESWETLSTKCSRLRSLTVRNSGAVHYLPSIQSLMALFPRLESITMMSLEFDSDPDLSALAAKTPDQHPLKHIHLSGSIQEPLKVLMDIVTQSPTIESLSVGFTLQAARRVEATVRDWRAIRLRWPCRDTLTHLDLTSVSFPGKTVFRQFFGRVQRLTRLRSLWISVSHIREAWPIAARNLRSVSTPSLDSSQSSSGGSHVHTSFICFRALETLQIGMAWDVNKKWLDMPVLFEEVVYMIDASPKLWRLELRHISESGVLKRLSAEYPKIEFS